MTERIIIAGSGGQGIMLLGKIMAMAAMQENKFVTWLPSYGAEVRGGTAHCMVTISDAEIGSPYIDKADSLIIMNKPSLDKFRCRLKNKGLLIVNNSLCQVAKNGNARIKSHQFSAIAMNLGNIRVANMVALGYFVSQKKTIALKSVLQAMADFAPPDKKDLIEINKKALEKGAGLK